MQPLTLADAENAASSASMQPLTLADAQITASSALGMSGGAEQTL